MNIEDLISQYLDGTLSSEAEAELHHRLSVSPEARKIFKAQIALQGIARDARVLHTPTVQMRNALFDRLQREEGMGSLADPVTSAPSLLEPAISDFASPRFVPPNKAAVRSDLAATPERERRRRRLVALLLPLLVLVIASGIVWQRGGFGGNEAEPSLAGNNTTQKGMGSGNDTLPQTTPQPGNEVSSWTRTEPSVTEKIGEELLAANQPGASSPREDHATFKNESSREQRYRYSIGEATSESPLPSSLQEDVDGGMIDAASSATEESEIHGKVRLGLDDDRITEPVKLDASERTLFLDGSGSAQIIPANADTLKIPARDFLAQGGQTTNPESPLDRGVVFSNSILPPSGSPILMGPTPTTSLSSTQSDSAAGYDRVFTNSAPPPPPIAADLHGINPRGVKAMTRSESAKDSRVETVLEKAGGKEQFAKAQKTEGAISPSSVASSSQGSVVATSSRIGEADILGLSGNRLTFTELATRRLLATKAVTHNAQLQLNLDTTLKIQGMLVQQGERKRVRGGTQLPYEVVDGKVVIDISALPAEQRQQLQDYLRKLGKAE